APAVGEGDFQHVRFLVQRNERRDALAHGTGSYATRSKSAPRSSTSVSRTRDDASAWISITRLGLYKPDTSTSEAGEFSAGEALSASAGVQLSCCTLSPAGRPASAVGIPGISLTPTCRSPLPIAISQRTCASMNCLPS